MSNNTEMVITIPLKATKMAPRTRRAMRAIKEVRDNVARHTGSDSDKVWISKALNEKIWERGIQHPPKKISLKAVRLDDGLVEVSLAETKVK